MKRTLRLESAGDFMRRYPRTTAHIIAESLGYAPRTRAAQIGLDGMNGRENYCELVYTCYGANARRCLENTIKNRHLHKGYEVLRHPTGDKEVRETLQHIIRSQPPRNHNGQALAWVLVDHGEYFHRSSIMGTGHHEII